MLKHLHVEHFAIIDTLDITFHEGLTVVTGETGSGKSIVLDALGLVLGDRADSSVVPPTAPRTVVVAEFELESGHPALAWLREQELDDGLNLLVQRTLTAEGRSRAAINGQPVTLSQLKALADLLVDLHGQHEHHALLKTAHQRTLLDLYGDLSEQKQHFRTLYQQWRKVDEELKAWRAAEASRQERHELLSYQVQELDALAPAHGEFSTLEAEQRQLAHAEDIKRLTMEVAYRLHGSDERDVLDELQQCRNHLEELLAHEARAAEWTERLTSCMEELRDLGHELLQHSEQVDMDPERLQATDERLAQWLQLARKHHVSPEDLPELHEALASELRDIATASEKGSGLARRAEQLHRDMLQAARTLSEGREAAARELEQAVNGILQRLGMAGAELRVAMETDLQHVDAEGADRIQYLIRTNPGMPLQPLAKIASGGELSRISLAIAVATASCAPVSVLIFDEVDVGIGGATAQTVGELLRTLAASRQVLSITHQPQVAGQGHHHLRIRKTAGETSVSAHCEYLEGADRIEELARMLGGKSITDVTRQHARELLATS
jgi:DNA repair protein RecN (Recombination protein N)